MLIDIPSSLVAVLSLILCTEQSGNTSIKIPIGPSQVSTRLAVSAVTKGAK
jgi:hypothetical protein